MQLRLKNTNVLFLLIGVVWKKIFKEKNKRNESDNVSFLSTKSK